MPIPVPARFLVHSLTVSLRAQVRRWRTSASLRFRAESRLKRSGGMCETYRAVDDEARPIDSPQSAIRLVCARSSPQRARLKQEAAILATLNHSNIAAVYGWEDTTDRPTLVLEVMEAKFCVIPSPRRHRSFTRVQILHSDCARAGSSPSASPSCTAIWTPMSCWARGCGQRPRFASS